jgi:hypothetical protein
MNPEIKRQTELFLCLALKRALPAYTFVPSEGGGLTADSTELEPPFVVLAMGNAQKVMAQEGTWRMAGTAQVITHIGDTRVTDHARLVRAVYAALESLSPGADGPHLPNFAFHGIDVAGLREATDEASKAHADIIDFTCGVGG